MAIGCSNASKRSNGQYATCYSSRLIVNYFRIIPHASRNQFTNRSSDGTLLKVVLTPFYIRIGCTKRRPSDLVLVSLMANRHNGKGIIRNGFPCLLPTTKRVLVYVKQDHGEMPTCVG